MNRSTAYIVIGLALLSCATTRPVASSEPVVDIVVSDSTPRDSNMDATDYYLRGVYLSRQREDATGAKEFLLRAIAADSTHGPSYFELAAISDFSTDSTLRYAQKAVQLDTTNGWYRELLSRVHATQGRLNSAIFEAEKMIELGLRTSDMYQYMSTLYKMRERPIMAMAVLDSAMTLYGYEPNLVQSKSELLSSIGMADKQIEFLEKVIASGESYQRYYLSLGEAYLQKGQDSVAISKFEAAREISSDDPAVAYTFMEYYRKAERVSDFISELINIAKSDYVPLENKISLIEPYMRNTKIYENHHMMDNLMTLLYYKYFDSYPVAKLYTNHKIYMGELGEALKVYTRYSTAEMESSDIKDAYQNVIGIHNYLQRQDSAMYYYKRAMEQLPGDTDITMLGVSIAYNTGDFEQAIKITKSTLKEIESDSIKSIQLGTIGDLYHEIDDQKSTYRYYDKALALDSMNLAVLNNYSYFLSEEERDLDRALAMAQTVINSGTSSATHIDTYAWILHKMGRNEEARKAMQRAVALNNLEEPTLFDHYAYILLALGDKSMARFYWQKALDSGLSQEEYDARIASLD